MVSFYSMLVAEDENNQIYFESITIWYIADVPLNPVSDYVHMLDLNTRLRVGWKTLPNLKFKLKFKTQISNSNLNFKNYNLPRLPG